jgi:hypothetical protein
VSLFYFYRGEEGASDVSADNSTMHSFFFLSLFRSFLLFSSSSSSSLGLSSCHSFCVFYSFFATSPFFLFSFNSCMNYFLPSFFLFSNSFMSLTLRAYCVISFPFPLITSVSFVFRTFIRSLFLPFFLSE